MEIENFIIYRKLCNTGSFTKVAKESFSTQSTISKKIKELEVFLNSSLLERKKFELDLKATLQGEEVLKFCNKLEKQLVILNKKLSNLQVETRIRFGIPPLIGNKVLKDIVLSILKITMENEYELDLIDTNINSSRKLLLNGEVDFILSYYLYDVYKNPQINSIRLHEMNFEIYGHEEVIKSMEFNISLVNLNNVTILSLEKGTTHYSLIQSIITRFKVRPQKIVYVSNFNILREMLLNKMGISILGEKSCFENEEIISVKANLGVKQFICIEYSKLKELTELDKKILKNLGGKKI